MQLVVEMETLPAFQYFINCVDIKPDYNILINVIDMLTTFSNT